MAMTTTQGWYRLDNRILLRTIRPTTPIMDTTTIERRNTNITILIKCRRRMNSIIRRTMRITTVIMALRRRNSVNHSSNTHKGVLAVLLPSLLRN